MRCLKKNSYKDEGCRTIRVSNDSNHQSYPSFNYQQQGNLQIRFDHVRPPCYQRHEAEAAATTAETNASKLPSCRDISDAALLRTSSLLGSLIIIVVCLSTFPFCANASILSRLVARMVVERAPGQNTTSKPAPEGMMKVENWSSNAVAVVSHSLSNRLLCLNVP